MPARWISLRFLAYAVRITHPVVVNDLRNHGDLASRGARLEEDDCKKIISILPNSNKVVLRTAADLDEAREVRFLHNNIISIEFPLFAVAAAAAAFVATARASSTVHPPASRPIQPVPLRLFLPFFLPAA